MISACFILNPKGIPIAKRQYKYDLPYDYIQTYVDQSIFIGDIEQGFVSPVFEQNGLIFCRVMHKGLHFVAISSEDANVFAMTEYLNKLIKVFASYFTEISESVLQDNITMVYELLDETLDFGVPQTLEPDVLKSFIQQKSLLETLLEKFQLKKKEQKLEAPPAVTGLVSWRKEGVKYRKNECFLDVVEKLDLVQTQEGRVLSSTVKGAFRLNSRLSGMPSLKLGLNDGVSFEHLFGRGKNQGDMGMPGMNMGATGAGASTSAAIELEELQLHQCVRLNQFSEDRTLSFIPPDGQFELLSYKLQQNGRRPPVSCAVQETRTGHGFTYNVQMETHFRATSTASEIIIQIPLPGDADSPDFRLSHGVAKYRPPLKCVEWTLKQVPGRTTASLVASFGLPTIRSRDEDVNAYARRPILIKFDIPHYCMSGINVRYLKVSEKSGYQATPWVRYISGGVITIRR